MLFIEERRRAQEERQRADQIMALMKETIDQLVEERRQSYARMQQAAAEHRLFVERLAEERRQSYARMRQAAEQAAAERRIFEERLAAERRQNAAERQAFLDILTKLTEAIGRNGRNHE